MIFDAQVADPVDPLARLGATARSLHDDRSGLLSPPVSTGSLTGLERSNESFDERADRLFVDARHLVDDGLPGEDVALDGEPRADAVPRPVVALGPGERCGAPVGGDDPELPGLPARIAGEHGLERGLRRGAALQLLDRQ